MADPPSASSGLENATATTVSVAQRLRQAEQAIAAIYEAASFGSHTLAADGSYATINRVELNWLGCTREELLGQHHPDEFLTSESQDKLQRQLREHGRGGFIDLELELVNSRKQHRLVSMHFNGTLSADGSSRPGRFVLFDQSDRQIARKLKSIAEMALESPYGMCVTDVKGTILRVNTGFTTLTGYTNQDVIGQNMRILSSGIQEPSFYATMWRTIHDLGYWQGEIRNRRKNGTPITEWLTIAAVKNAQGQVVNYVGTFYDLSEGKVIEEAITRMTFHDALTELPNRRLLQQRIEHAAAIAGRNGLHSALLYIDLDHFKAINDTQGHDVGDWMLMEAGKRIQAEVRSGDTVARVGGDEFVVLLEGMGSAMLDAGTQARQVAEKIRRMLALPYQYEQVELLCSASIGISMVHPGESVTHLLTYADLAMYQAKKIGRNAVQFFNPVMQSEATSRFELEQELRRALAHDEFELHYQPQVDTQGQLVGVEALLRWHHPVRGLVYPGEFIAIAEENGLIVPIGLWVLQTACRQLASWASSPASRRLPVAVNVSARQFMEDDFVAVVQSALRETGADPRLLELEVTESMMVDVDRAIPKMQELRAIGLTFSVDDFGTGYSSLAHLTRLPIAKLKIDQSFVRNMDVQPADRIIVQAIIGLAHSLGLSVIAEGVETQAQREQLQALECNQFQGYLFGKAQPAAAIEQLLNKTPV